MVTLMHGVSHAVEVLVLGLLVVVYDSIHCIFNTVVVVDCHIFSLFLPMTFFNILMN